MSRTVKSVVELIGTTPLLEISRYSEKAGVTGVKLFANGKDTVIMCNNLLNRYVL